jgi:hypothetical protein
LLKEILAQQSRSMAGGFITSRAWGLSIAIDTRWLDDGSIGDAERAKHVERFADTPPTGGTGIDAAGNIYVSNTDRERVIKTTPGGKVSTLIQDPRPLAEMGCAQFFCASDAGILPK